MLVLHPCSHPGGRDPCSAVSATVGRSGLLCHRGKHCLSPGMSAVDHQRISPWGFQQSRGPRIDPALLLSSPCEKVRMWKRWLFLLRGAHRGGLGGLPVGSLCPALLSPLATCLDVPSLREGMVILWQVYWVFFFPIQLLERQLTARGPQTPASVFWTPVMSNYKSSLARWSWWLGKKLSCEPGC